MNKFLYIFLILFAFPSIGQVRETNAREKLSLDKGWKFFKGEIPFPGCERAQGKL
jgi:hypothetical protein